MNILYYLKKANVTMDALCRVSIGSVTHVVDDKNR